MLLLHPSEIGNPKSGILPCTSYSTDHRDPEGHPPMATANAGDPEFGASAPKADGSKPGHRLQCVVVTPERTLFDDYVEFVALPLFDGELGVLPGRSPLIGRLGYGELRTRAGGTNRRYFVDGGFVQVRDDVITVLTNRATPAIDVDV